MERANIKLKGGKQFSAKKCKIELTNGKVIWAGEVEFQPDYLPSCGDYLPEDVYFIVPYGERYCEHIPRNDIKKMSIVK